MYIYVSVSVDIYAVNLFTEHSENTDENKLFCLFNPSFLAKLSTYRFEYSGGISCSLLVKPSHTDESWAGRNKCLYIYIYIRTKLMLKN